MSLPEPKASPGDLVTKRLNELAQHAGDNAAASLGEGPAQWYMPKELTGTLLEPNNLSPPFSREQQETEFEKAVTNQASFGTITDLAMSQLQGDLMHCAERAFRSRHHTTVRSRIHPAARQRGHASLTGVIINGMLGYIVALDRINKSESL